MSQNNIYQTDDGLPFVEVPWNHDGVVALGCNLPDPLFSALPDSEQLYKTLPVSQWQENSLSAAKPPQRDQGRYGSCGGQATVTAFQVAKKLAGHSDHHYSATFIYGNVNGGADNGSRIADCMMEIIKTGTCLQAQVPDNLIFTQQFPSDSFKTAKRFKALEAYKCKSFEDMCTALTLGQPVVSGFACGRNLTLSQLDANGVAYLPDSIVGGHAICHVGLKLIKGVWCVETQNSWGSSWGMNGKCYMRKEHWSPGYGMPFDAFVIYSVVEDPEDKADDLPVIIDSPVKTVEPNIDTVAKTKKNKKEIQDDR